jgi:hypothetical protein
MVVIRRWKRWLKIIDGEIIHLSHQRHIFRVISEMFQANPTLQQSGGTVWLWFAENYATTAAVAVRRQADRGGRRPVVSLECLLTEIAANPRVLTREWFVRQYVRGKPAITRRHFQAMGEHDFDKFAGRTSKRISVRKVLSDRRQLRRAAARVRNYVNKRIAHRALSGYSGPATFADLDAAMDELGRLLGRYSMLLNQAGMMAGPPTIQEDWETVFRVPWRN